MIGDNGIVTINSLSWDVFMRGLDAVRKTTADSVPDFIPRLFNVEKKKRKDIHEKTWNGIPPAMPWPGDANGLPMPTQGVSTGFDILALNAWSANSVQFTLDMKAHDEYDLMNKMSKDLGQSFPVRRNQLGLASLCAGFSTVWNAQEGQTLFSASHPLDSRYLGGNAVASNLVTGGPSVSALSNAITTMLMTPDQLGSPTTIMPKFLLCSTTMYLQWKQVIGTVEGRTDTASHTPNPFEEYHLTLVPCRWIDQINTKYWFLFGDKHGAIFNQSQPLRYVNHTSKKTQVTFYGGFEEFCIYYRNWRGIVGSQG